MALVGTLAKVSGQYTSTGVLLLSQNLICLLFMLPVALRGGWSSLRTGKIGLHLLRATTGTACWYALFFAITQIPLVQRDAADLQRATVDATHRLGRHPRTGVHG